MKRATKPVGPPAPHPLLVDENDRTPLYHRIFMILRSKIIAGDFSEASYLPSENELAKMYGVSRITTIRALNELAAQGLVSRERGRGTRVRLVESGTIVRGPAERLKSVRFKRDRSLDDQRIKVVAFDTVRAPEEVAEIFGISATSQVSRIIRVGVFEKKPYRYLTSYLPIEITKGWTRSQLRTTNIVFLIEKSGIRMGRIDERMTASLADSTAAGHLEVAVGSPLLKIMRTVFDTSDRAIEYVVGYYPPERYEYAVSVTRQGHLLSPIHALS